MRTNIIKERDFSILNGSSMVVTIVEVFSVTLQVDNLSQSLIAIYLLIVGLRKKSSLFPFMNINNLI